MCRMVEGRAELVGLVSFGVGCNSTLNGRPHFTVSCVIVSRVMVSRVTCPGEKLPGVYSRVSEGLDWIRDTISDGQC